MTSAAGVHSVLLRPASLIGLLACLVGVASAEKNVVFIGDMQCQYMNVPGCASCNETTGMYGQLRDRTRSAMLTLDPAAGPVSWTFNCIGGRRIGSCDLDCGVAGPFWSQYHSESTWASHCAAETSCCGRADCKPTAEREVAEYCTSVQANQTVDTTVLVVQSGLADLNSIHWRGGGAHPELIRSLERLRNAVSAHCHPMTALVIVETFPLQETPGSWTAGGTDAASCTSEWLCADGRSFWLAEAMRTQAATTASPLFRPTFFFDTSHLVVAPAAHGMYYTDDISIRQVSEALAARLAHLLQFEITSHSCALNTDVVPGMVLNQCPTIVTSGDICTAGCAAGYFWVTDAGLPQIGCSGSVLNWNFYCKANAPTPAPVPPALAPADLTVNALVIGDSQCRRMSPPYAALNLFDLVTSLTASTIRKYMESTVTEVEFTWDCDMNLRRFDQCSMNCADAEPRWQALSAVEKGATGSSDWANQCQDMQAQCSTGTQAIRSSCLDAPPDIVVVMLGTAELDALVWRDASRSSRMAHIEQMLDSVKLWCQGVSSVVLVSPLPIQTEAGSVNAADNTCNVRWGCDDDRQATLEQEMQDIARTYSALRVQFLNSTASTTVSQYDTVDRVHYSGSTAVIETSAAVGRVVGQLACVSQTAPAIGADSAELYCGINLATCAHPEEGQLTILTDPNAVWSTTEANAQCTEMLNSANFGQGMDPVANRLTCEDRDRTAADTLWGVAIVCIFMLVVIELVMMVGVKLNPMSEDFAERLSNAKARTDVSYPEIDGLRAIASIHIMVFNLNKYLMAGGTSYSCNFCGYGKYWLQAMFTISGFLSAAGWYLQPERRAVVLTHPCRWTVTYVIQSVVRWMPLYLASIGLSLLGRAMSSKEFSLEGGDLTMSIFMVQSWFSPYHWDFNDPTFFMSNLFLFTILFPHWMNATIRFSGSLNGIILFLAWLASFGPTMACYVFFDMALYKKMYGNSVHDFIEFHPFSNWPAYLCGVLLAQILSPWLYQKVTTTAATHRLLGGATTATLVAVFLFFYFGTSPGDYMGKYSLLFEKGPFAIPVVLILLTAGSLNATTDLQKPAKHNHPAGPMGRPSSNNLRDDEHDNQPAPKAEELEKLNKPRSLLVRGMVGFLHFFNSIGGKFLVWLQPLHVIAWPLFILHAGIDEFLKPITQWITSGRMSLRAIFELADRDSSGSLNMSEYTVLAHNLNATMGTALVADAFSVADADGDGMLAPSECVLCLWADANKDFVVSSDELNDAVGTVKEPPGAHTSSITHTILSLSLDCSADSSGMGWAGFPVRCAVARPDSAAPLCMAGLPTDRTPLG